MSLYSFPPRLNFLLLSVPLNILRSFVFLVHFPSLYIFFSSPLLHSLLHFFHFFFFKFCLFSLYPIFSQFLALSLFHSSLLIFRLFFLPFYLFSSNSSFLSLFFFIFPLHFPSFPHPILFFLPIPSFQSAYSKPFEMRVLTNNVEDSTEKNNRGFSIRYTQIPC